MSSALEIRLASLKDELADLKEQKYIAEDVNIKLRKARSDEKKKYEISLLNKDQEIKNLNLKLNYSLDENKELREQLNEVNEKYSRYFDLDDESKEILDVVAQLAHEGHGEFNQYRDAYFLKSIPDNTCLNDITYMRSKLDNILHVLFTQNKCIREKNREYDEKKAAFKCENQKLLEKCDLYKLKLDENQKIVNDLNKRVENLTEKNNLLNDNYELIHQQIQKYEKANTIEYRTALRLFFDEFQHNISNLNEIINYFLRRTSSNSFDDKQMFDCSNLTSDFNDNNQWSLFDINFVRKKTKLIEMLRSRLQEFKIKIGFINPEDF